MIDFKTYTIEKDLGGELGVQKLQVTLDCTGGTVTIAEIELMNTVLTGKLSKEFMKELNQEMSVSEDEFDSEIETGSSTNYFEIAKGLVRSWP